MRLGPSPYLLLKLHNARKPIFLAGVFQRSSLRGPRDGHVFYLRDIVTWAPVIIGGRSSTEAAMCSALLRPLQATSNIHNSNDGNSVVSESDVMRLVRAGNFGDSLFFLLCQTLPQRFVATKAWILQ